MSNPTTAKPSSAVYNSGATLGANLQAMVALTEGAGSPIEMVGQVLGNPMWMLANAGTNNSNARSGPPPAWSANGFNPYGTALGPSIHFDHSTRPLFYGSGGFPTSSSNGAGANAHHCDRVPAQHHALQPQQHREHLSVRAHQLRVPRWHGAGSGRHGNLVDQQRQAVPPGVRVEFVDTARHPDGNFAEPVVRRGRNLRPDLGRQHDQDVLPLRPDQSAVTPRVGSDARFDRQRVHLRRDVPDLCPTRRAG